MLLKYREAGDIDIKILMMQGLLILDICGAVINVPAQIDIFPPTKELPSSFCRPYLLLLI